MKFWLSEIPRLFRFTSHSIIYMALYFMVSFIFCLTIWKGTLRDVLMQPVYYTRIENNWGNWLTVGNSVRVVFFLSRMSKFNLCLQFAPHIKQWSVTNAQVNNCSLIYCQILLHEEQYLHFMFQKEVRTTLLKVIY